MKTRLPLHLIVHQVIFFAATCTSLFAQSSLTDRALVPRQTQDLDHARVQTQIHTISTDSNRIGPSRNPINKQPIAAAAAAPQDETIVPVPGVQKSIFGELPSLWTATDSQHRITGFVDLNTYWDTRNFSSTTVNLLANLPYDFQYFQLLNLEGSVDSGSHDLRNFFTEMNLRRKVSRDNPILSHLDWTMQYADGTIPHGVLRFGCRCRVQDSPGRLGRFFKDVLKVNYSINFHFLETDSSGWQIEQVYRRQFLDGKVYVAGFCDHNIDDGGDHSTWVTEHQVGLQVFDSMYLVAEHRYNSFFPSGSRQGLGIGLEYVMRFK